MEAEEAAQSFDDGYINESDPSVLRFLIASRRAGHACACLQFESAIKQ